jgi:hypothetical protein
MPLVMFANTSVTAAAMKKPSKEQAGFPACGITDNWELCHAFSTEVTRLLYKWLNRQSQKRSYDWERFNDALAWVGWPSAYIKHQLNPFRPLPTRKGS